MIPLDEREKKNSHYVVNLELEYLSLFKELELKNKCCRFNQQINSHYVDYDNFFILRLSHCLKQWDFPAVLPELEVSPLQSVGGILTDESLGQWRNLPPLIRKAILARINEVMGPI